MYQPPNRRMERGWVGRVDGEHVVHLAAQTLESYFTGGGSAREHAVYPLDAVRLLAPVLHPPSVRLFDDESTFAFANPAAIVAPGATVRRPSDTVSQGELYVLPRLAAMIGADQQIGGFTILGEWRDPAQRPPKDRDFALSLGPVLVTADELDLGAAGGSQPFDWEEARALAARGTVLRAGDLLGSPPRDPLTVAAGARVELEVEGIGVLDAAAEAR
jgi:hypothetical protein